VGGGAVLVVGLCVLRLTLISNCSACGAESSVVELDGFELWTALDMLTTARKDFPPPPCLK